MNTTSNAADLENAINHDDFSDDNQQRFYKLLREKEHALFLALYDVRQLRTDLERLKQSESWYRSALRAQQNNQLQCLQHHYALQRCQVKENQRLQRECLNLYTRCGDLEHELQLQRQHTLKELAELQADTQTNVTQEEQQFELFEDHQQLIEVLLRNQKQTLLQQLKLQRNLSEKEWEKLQKIPSDCTLYEQTQEKDNSITENDKNVVKQHAQSMASVLQRITELEKCHGNEKKIAPKQAASEAVMTTTNQQVNSHQNQNMAANLLFQIKEVEEENEEETFKIAEKKSTGEMRKQNTFQMQKELFGFNESDEEEAEEEYVERDNELMVENIFQHLESSVFKGRQDTELKEMIENRMQSNNIFKLEEIPDDKLVHKNLFQIEDTDEECEELDKSAIVEDILKIVENAASPKCDENEKQGKKSEKAEKREENLEDFDEEIETDIEEELEDDDLSKLAEVSKIEEFSKSITNSKEKLENVKKETLKHESSQEIEKNAVESKELKKENDKKEEAVNSSIEDFKVESSIDEEISSIEEEVAEISKKDKNREDIDKSSEDEHKDIEKEEKNENLKDQTHSFLQKEKYAQNEERYGEKEESKPDDYKQTNDKENLTLGKVEKNQESDTDDDDKDQELSKDEIHTLHKKKDDQKDLGMKINLTPIKTKESDMDNEKIHEEDKVEVSILHKEKDPPKDPRMKINLNPIKSRDASTDDDDKIQEEDKDEVPILHKEKDQQKDLRMKSYLNSIKTRDSSTDDEEKVQGYIRDFHEKEDEQKDPKMKINLTPIKSRDSSTDDDEKIQEELSKDEIPIIQKVKDQQKDPILNTNLTQIKSKESDTDDDDRDQDNIRDFHKKEDEQKDPKMKINLTPIKTKESVTDDDEKIQEELSKDEIPNFYKEKDLKMRRNLSPIKTKESDTDDDENVQEEMPNFHKEKDEQKDLRMRVNLTPIKTQESDTDDDEKVHNESFEAKEEAHKVIGKLLNKVEMRVTDVSRAHKEMESNEEEKLEGKNKRQNVQKLAREQDHENSVELQKCATETPNNVDETEKETENNMEVLQQMQFGFQLLQKQINTTQSIAHLQNQQLMQSRTELEQLNELFTKQNELLEATHVQMMSGEAKQQQIIEEVQKLREHFQQNVDASTILEQQKQVFELKLQLQKLHQEREHQISQMQHMERELSKHKRRALLIPENTEANMASTSIETQITDRLHILSKVLDAEQRRKMHRYDLHIRSLLSNIKGLKKALRLAEKRAAAQEQTAEPQVQIKRLQEELEEMKQKYLESQELIKKLPKQNMVSTQKLSTSIEETLPNDVDKSITVESSLGSVKETSNLIDDHKKLIHDSAEAAKRFSTEEIMSLIECSDKCVPNLDNLRVNFEGLRTEILMKFIPKKRRYRAPTLAEELRAAGEKTHSSPF